MEFTVEFYENPNGRPVVEEELEEIGERIPVVLALLLAGINKLKRSEYHKPPLCLPIGDGLFEIRVGGRDIARAIWFFQQGQRIVIVRCFIKKSQKTPEADIRLAQQRRKDYIQRYGR